MHPEASAERAAWPATGSQLLPPPPPQAGIPADRVEEVKLVLDPSFSG